MTTTRTHRQRSAKGLTLVELLVTVAILAILAAITAPSIQTALDRRRVIGAIDNLLTDLRYAQSESLKRNEILEMVFTTGTLWQYVIQPGSGVGDSTFVSKTVTSGDYSGTKLSAPGGKVIFDPKRATVALADPAAWTVAEVESANGQKLQIRFSEKRSSADAVGKAAFSVCTDTGLGGYSAC